MRTSRKFIAIAAACLTYGLATVAFGQYYPPPPPPILPQIYSPYPNPYQQVPMGLRCATPYGVCFMSAAGPVGTACTCVTQQGYIPGQIYP